MGRHTSEYSDMFIIIIEYIYADTTHTGVSLLTRNTRFR